jgi:hypothetical protein
MEPGRSFALDDVAGRVFAYRQAAAPTGTGGHGGEGQAVPRREAVLDSGKASLQSRAMLAMTAPEYPEIQGRRSTEQRHP